MVESISQRVALLYEKFETIISEIFPVKEEENFFKFIIYFKDGSHLRATEYWKGKSLEHYSYYHLDRNNALITGWDNAPHHKHIQTFPHHKHFKKSIFPSQERSLEDVLTLIFSKHKPTR